MIKKKIINSFFIIGLLFSFFVPVIMAEAATYKGILTGDDVAIRKGAGTNYDVIKRVDKNVQVNMVDSTIKIYKDESTSTNKCDAGWYYIYLPSSTTEKGYVCSTYLTVSIGEAGTSSDVYGRPWLSPKQSIVGGAIFSAKDYIAKGQFTSYLFKYNVNPANSNLHSHQYMTNIRAPYLQAETSYTSYSKSGLINQALVFSIPVFNSMPSATNLTGYSRTNVGQTTVTDLAFEAVLDAQKFPENYKQYLRKAHSDHPNWVFEAMNTGITWSTAVTAQQKVGAIDSTNTAYCEVQSNGSCKQTEKGWYLPTSTAVAYFLDPRNSLDDKHILQFEKLSFSETIKESDVQFVLSGTFMSGNSVIDNQSYASIFVEAGRVANVNPVYLASKSKQEVGVNGSMATTGEMFTYEDVTYVGLYNFYNIGASSSASNPVKAGLKWAAGGSLIPIVSGTINQALLLNNYKVNNTSLYGIKLDTTINAFKSQMTGFTVTVVDKDNKTVANTNKIATGYKITITKDGETFTYTAIIYGDITGKGEVNIADIVALRQHLLNSKKLSSEYLTAADANRDGSVNIADIVALRQHILKQKTISQS